MEFKEGDMVYNAYLNQIFKYLSPVVELNLTPDTLRAENVMKYETYGHRVSMYTRNCRLATEKEIADAVAERISR